MATAPQITNLQQRERERNAQQMAADLAQAASFAQPPDVPTAQPFTADHDAALAASINELKERDLEYKRLASEEARQQWESTARANLIRTREHAEQQQREKEGREVRTQAVDDKRVIELLQHANELQASLPTDRPITEWNMPLDQFRDVTKTMQELDAAAKQRGLPGLDMFAPVPPVQQQQQQHPETFSDGSKVQITQNADGTLEAKLITGEVFRGDPLTVTRKLGEAQVNTKRWGQQQRAGIQQPQAQPTDTGNGSSAVAFDPNGTPLVDFSKIPDVTRWQFDQMGQALGYKDGQEMINDQIRVRQETERLSRELADQRESREVENIATTFQIQNPDFPGTNEAIEALASIMDRNGLEYTPANLSMAHSYAVGNSVYQPLTPDMIAAANSGGRTSSSMRVVAPPPPPPASAIDNRGPAGEHEWNMPLDKLRKQILDGQQSRQEQGRY